MLINRLYVIEKLVDLVKINSVNPSCDPSGKGEAEIGDYLARELTGLGLNVEVQTLAPHRVNVVGVLPGSGDGRSLMWNAHTDTVGAGGMSAPFDPVIHENRLFGRGSIDMKASLAAMLGGIRALVEHNHSLAGDLVFAAVADEEFGSIGTQALLPKYKTDGAIVTEPTDLHICQAHRGYVHYKVDTIGRAAHGSRYLEGIDANMMMGRFLAKLDLVEQELRSLPPHPLVGVPSLHAAMLSGGSELSIYAALCSLYIERRTVMGETEKEITAGLQTVLDLLHQQDARFQGSVQVLAQRSPFEVASHAFLVTCLSQAAASRLGQTLPTVGMPFWTDAALLSDAGVESVVFGPTGGGLHSDIEWAELNSVVDLASILASTALAYCGGKQL